MSKSSEIEVLISEIKQISPNIEVHQRTSFGEKPFESGVWKLWSKDNANVYVQIEVQNGMIWAIYGSKEFNNKYPINAENICEFLNS